MLVFFFFFSRGYNPKIGLRMTAICFQAIVIVQNKVVVITPEIDDKPYLSKQDAYADENLESEAATNDFKFSRQHLMIYHLDFQTSGVVYKSKIPRNASPIDILCPIYEAAFIDV